MIKEVCINCHNKHYTWSSADDSRWERDELVLCPPPLMKAEEDNRVLRATTNDLPCWCPYKKDHSPRRRKNQREIEGAEPREDLGPF